MVEGVDLEALVHHGGRIRQNRLPMVSTGTFPRPVGADGEGAGQEAPAVGVQSVREARSMVEAEGAEARRGKGECGW